MPDAQGRFFDPVFPREIRSRREADSEWPVSEPAKPAKALSQVLQVPRSVKSSARRGRLGRPTAT